MTEDQKRFILDRLGKMPQVEIAKRAGVTQVAISALKRRLNAKAIAAELPPDRRRDRRFGTKR